MTCVVVAPVLQRPHRVRPLMESFASTVDARLLFVANRSDSDELSELEAAGADFMVVPDRQISYPAKINAAYRATTEPLLFLGADDLRFHDGWLGTAMVPLADPAVHVVGTNDLGNPRVVAGEHSTHSLVTRSYCDHPGGTVDRPGSVLHEGYRHWFVDDELVQVAQSRGVYAHAHQAVVEHLHPFHGKAAQDATYRRGGQHRHNDRRLFNRRRLLWT